MYALLVVRLRFFKADEKNLSSSIVRYQISNFEYINFNVKSMVNEEFYKNIVNVCVPHLEKLPIGNFSRHTTSVTHAIPLICNPPTQSTPKFHSVSEPVSEGM